MKNRLLNYYKENEDFLTDGSKALIMGLVLLLNVLSLAFTYFFWIGIIALMCYIFGWAFSWGIASIIVVGLVILTYLIRTTFSKRNKKTTEEGA